MNTYRTLVIYTNHACLFHASEGESSGQSSLFAKALLCTASVVKADRVQGGATYKPCIREISISVVTNGPFW